QAEDGIRDYKVTGVQTCALPIFPFTCALTSALAGRPVLYEEFGLCTWEADSPSGYAEMMLPYGKKHRQWFSSQEDGAEYYQKVRSEERRVGKECRCRWVACR